MRLLLPANTLERALAAAALAEIPGDCSVYGCGPVEAGEGFDDLIAEHQAGNFRGTVGLVITEELVGGYAAELRAHLGAIVQLGGQPVVADALSEEWALHLGFKAKRGTWAGWACREEQARSVLTDVAKHPSPYPLAMTRGDDWLALGCGDGLYWGGSLIDRMTLLVSANDVGVAIACAILDIPCLLLAQHPWGLEHNARYLPIVRWAQDAGVERNVVWSAEELKQRIEANDVDRVSRDIVAARRAQALEMLQDAGAERDPLAEALGAEPKPAPPGERRALEVGSIFDPATHYADDYYGQAGINYVLPSGEWARDPYRGTAHYWNGFKLVASWLAQLLGPSDKPRSLLDLGCGSGDFVKHAFDLGFDAFGLDISEDAVKRAHESVRCRIHARDITEGNWGLPELDLITAWDLWEHIPASKVPALVMEVQKGLCLGGLGAFVICTRGDGGEQDWTLEPPCEVTKENSWLLVAGHLTIRRWFWWLEMFAEHWLLPRWDLMARFNALKAEEPTMRGADSWSARNVVIVERVQ